MKRVARPASAPVIGGLTPRSRLPSLVSSGTAGPRSSQAQVWSVLFLIYTAIAILLTGYRYLDDLSAATGRVRFGIRVFGGSHRRL